MRHRHDHLLGLDYQSVDELKPRCEALPRSRSSMTTGPLVTLVTPSPPARAPRRRASRSSSASSSCRLRGRSPGPGERRCQTPSPSSSHEFWLSAKARSSVSSSSARSSGGFDRHGQLDAVVEVARHQVGRGDVDRVLAVALEGVDARVLEQPPDDRDDADVLRDPGQPGRRQQIPRTFRSTLHARLRGRVERADAAPVDERVHLHRDPRG